MKQRASSGPRPELDGEGASGGVLVLLLSLILIVLAFLPVIIG
jgi:hypothetical protein